MGVVLAINDVFKGSEMWRRGLQFVEDYPSNGCAVFSDCGGSRILRFWGKNTLMPLDIVFVDENMEVDSIKQIEPMDESPVESDGRCIMAIEAPRGAASEIEVGMSVSLGQGYARFE